MIRKVCISTKAAETREVMKLVDDEVNIAQQFRILMKDEASLRVITDSSSLKESIGCSCQVAEVALTQSVAFLNQSLEDN